MPDGSGPRALGAGDVGGAREHAPGADLRGHDVGRIDPVLERDHRRVRAEQGGERPCRAVGVAELDDEQHRVDRAHRARVLLGGDGVDGNVAERALQPQTAPPQRP